MRITRLISIADILTLVNALLGFSAIILALDGQIVFSIYAILLGILCDGLDGVDSSFARVPRSWRTGFRGSFAFPEARSFCTFTWALARFTSRNYTSRSRTAKS